MRMRPDGETAERGDGAALEPWSREGVPGVGRWGWEEPMQVRTKRDWRPDIGDVFEEDQKGPQASQTWGLTGDDRGRGSKTR